MVLLEPELSCQGDAAALGCRDRGSRTAKSTAAPAPDLDKHELRAVGHDQIDFAKATGKLTGHQAQACPLQMLKRQVLGCVAIPLGRRAIHMGSIPFSLQCR